jgi:CubicO group peptidase (beta-lactamase class C family)
MTEKLQESPPTAAQLGLMQGDPVPPDKLVTLDRWQDWPWNRWSYQHIDELIPCERIGRGDRTSELLPDHMELGGVTFATGAGEDVRLDAFLKRTCTDGFLVLRQGRVVTEQYGNGMTPATRHLLQSVSKSFTGVLAGILTHRGLLDPASPVTEYVPELGGSSFEAATVRQVLDMTTGTAFSEDYDDPESDICRYEGAAGWRSRSAGDDADLLDYMYTLRNHRRHGEVFEYRSILTDLLGIVVERVSGEPFATLAGNLLWAPLGAEHDATITVDRRGNPMTDGGVAMSLRDLARFGRLLLEGGVALGRQVVPIDWIEDVRRPDEACLEAFSRSDSASRYPKGHYRNQWWVPDREAGILLGAGIYGQFLYLDVPTQVAIAKLSTLPFALDLDVSADHRRAFAAVVETIR